MQPRTARNTIIRVNGEQATTEARTLAELIAGRGLEEGQVATALNGVFVPRHARASTLLSEGDQVEVVAPRQGG